MARVLIIRHGSTDLTKTHLYGRTPGIPLNDAGRRQATLLAPRLAGLDAIFTSPIQRARETAAIIAGPYGLTPTVVDDFAEYDFGDWTGRVFKELNQAADWKAFNAHRETARPPGGESMPEVQRRAIRALEPLIAGYPDGRIGVVSHGDVIRALLLHATGSAIPNYWRFAVEPTSICELEGDSATSLRLIRANDCAHLEQLPPELQ